jgi:ATP synthase protein I
MADGARDEDDGSRRPDEAALSARLKSLGERLDDAAASQPRTGPAPRSTAEQSALARGFRMATEFVVGILAGAFLGWLVDRWLGTSPWGLIVLLLLGFVAGVFNVVRAARASG